VPLPCAFPQERIRIPDDKMKYYENLAEMYVGDDVSPDFYGWVFPKYDHVAVGTGTVVNKTAIKQYQQATRDRSSVSPPLLPELPPELPEPAQP
jgi:geranylgeranyl reductase